MTSQFHSKGCEQRTPSLMKGWSCCKMQRHYCSVFLCWRWQGQSPACWVSSVPACCSYTRSRSTWFNFTWVYSIFTFTLLTLHYPRVYYVDAQFRVSNLYFTELNRGCILWVYVDISIYLADANLTSCALPLKKKASFKAFFFNPILKYFVAIQRLFLCLIYFSFFSSTNG